MDSFSGYLYFSRILFKQVYCVREVYRIDLEKATLKKFICFDLLLNFHWK